MSSKKAPNFTELEKEILTDVLNTDGRKDVVEDKHNNWKMIAIKERVWDQVVTCFNATYGVNIRTKKQLKDAWKNMKARTKSKKAEMNRDVRATGGGSATSTGLDGISEKVLAMIPEQILSLRNPYDDDAKYHEQHLAIDETVPKETHVPESTQSGACGTGTPDSSAAEASTPTADERRQSMQSANKKKQSYLEMFNVPKSKPECVGKQETGKAPLLQMAEEEHEEKMKVLALKKEVLELKKAKNWKKNWMVVNYVTISKSRNRRPVPVVQVIAPNRCLPVFGNHFNASVSVTHENTHLPFTVYTVGVNIYA